MLEARVFDTVTGDFKLTVPASAGDWSARLDGTSKGSVTVPLRLQGISRTTARALFNPNASLIALVDEHGVVPAAGMVMDVDFSWSTGSLVAQWVDLRDIFRKRLGHGVGSWGPGGTLTVTNRSYAGAVRAIVWRAMREGTLPTWGLPVVLPADGSGTFSRTWRYYEFATMDDALREIEKEGHEVYLDPLIDGGNLRFQVKVGKPIVGGQIDLPLNVPETRLLDFHSLLSGVNQYTGVIYGGNGTEAGQLTAWAGEGAAGYPIMDAYASAKDIKSVAQLQRIANANFAANRLPEQQFTYGVRLGEPVRHQHVKPSSLHRIDIRGSEWDPDGVTVARVLSTTGDLTSDSVSTEVAIYG